MDYEKKYKAALERAKEYLTPNNPECIDTLDAITTIFPELKKSDDERTRKDIIDFVKSSILTTDERYNRFLNWIEEQVPKNKTALDKVIEEEVDAWFEKQKEEEPQVITNSKDEKTRKSLIEYLKGTSLQNRVIII